MGENVLIVEKPRPGLAVLTLNRPNAMNALSVELRQALTRTMREMEAVGDVHVVILTGAGRAFCAGLDLKEMSTNSVWRSEADSYNPAAAVRAFSGVVVGAINGVAVTGGFELALACDILLASDTARFADTHIKVGVMPGWELSQRLSRTIGLSRAKHLSLTGRYISAKQAEAWGIVSQTVENGHLLEAARSLADELLLLPPAGLRAYKKLIDDGYAVTLQEGLAIETERAVAHNAVITPDAIAARRADVQQHGRSA